MFDIKAYSVNDRIVVQYFDSGESETLSCPNCGWKGGLCSETENEFIEMHCPHCSTLLACSTATEQYSEPEFSGNFKYRR